MQASWLQLIGSFHWFASQLPKLFNLKNPLCLAFLRGVSLDAQMGGVCLSAVLEHSLS
jgi:hypothetical protein